jgi:hypothetical protein
VTITAIQKKRRFGFKFPSAAGESLTQWDVSEWQSVINVHTEMIITGVDSEDWGMLR